MAAITRRGPKQWRARVRRGGHTVSKTFETRDAAEAWARDIEADIKDGTLASRTEAEATTLAQALERYEKEITPGKRSADREIGEIRRMKARPIAAKVLAAIRGKDLAEYVRGRQAEGVGANAIRIELALISHLYTVARSAWGMESLVNPVPLAKTARPKLPAGRDRRLHPGEETWLLKAAVKYGEDRGAGEIGAIIQLALETAMRRGEIAGMRWEHVDRRARVLRVPETKNGEPRRVPLSTAALAVLATREDLPRQIDGRVWSMRPDSITQAFERVIAAAQEDHKAECKKAGKKPDSHFLQGLRFHDLRHEATSRLFERGLNPMQVAAITGHKTLQMLKRYTHLRAEDLAALLG